MCERRDVEAKDAATAKRIFTTFAAAPEVRCYNCGDRGHQSHECLDAERDPNVLLAERMNTSRLRVRSSQKPSEHVQLVVKVDLPMSTRLALTLCRE